MRWSTIYLSDHCHFVFSSDLYRFYSVLLLGDDPRGTYLVDPLGLHYDRFSGKIFVVWVDTICFVLVWKILETIDLLHGE